MKIYLAVVFLSAIALRVSAFDYRRQAGQSQSNYVAFSAGLTKNAQLAGNETIKYDHVYTNYGNGYNNNTGVFTCPTAGTYVFLFSGLAETAGQMWLDVYKNGVYEATGYAHNSADYASASNSVVLDLAVGDTIYIQGHGDNTLYGRTDEIYSTLSGFLLYPSTGQ